MKDTYEITLFVITHVCYIITEGTRGLHIPTTMPIGCSSATSLTIAINLISIAIDHIDMTLMLHMAFQKLGFSLLHVKRAVRAAKTKRNENYSENWLDDTSCIIESVPCTKIFPTLYGLNKLVGWPTISRIGCIVVQRLFHLIWIFGALHYRNSSFILLQSFQNAFWMCFYSEISFFAPFCMHASCSLH